MVLLIRPKGVSTLALVEAATKAQLNLKFTTNVTKNLFVTDHFKRHRDSSKNSSLYWMREESFASCAHNKDDNNQNKDDL